MKQKSIYFDYAATTPLDPAVVQEMARVQKQFFGNPASLHGYGQEALAVVDGAREVISKSIGAKFQEIIFTGSATEANNLALRGVIAAHRRLTQTLTQTNADKLKVREGLRPRLIISAVEHESIRETARDLEAHGMEVVWIPVDQEGIVNIGALRNALSEQTLLVSVMYVNNVVGTIQPIEEIGKVIKEFKKKRKGNILYPLFHTDAVQAFQYLDCNADMLGVDLMTLSAHKIYGPKGVGALYVRQKDVRLKKYEVGKKDSGKTFLPLTSYVLPLVTGGGQEYGLRSGTVNVPGVAGFAKAIELASRCRTKEALRVAKLRDYAFKEIKKRLPDGIFVNGARTERIPNNINIFCKGKDALDLSIRLDRMGIAVSAGPACASRTAMPSPVLNAMGFSDERAKGSLRITLGRQTTRRAIDALLGAFVELYPRGERP